MPRSASGIKATMMSALKMMALKMALSGEVKRMIFSVLSGPVVMPAAA
jgi:hypothetical protein